MKITLSHFSSHQTWVEIRTKKWKKYTTDDFRRSIIDVLVSQEPEDSIEELFIHRWTSKNQVLAGNLDESIKQRIIVLLN